MWRSLKNQLRRLLRPSEPAAATPHAGAHEVHREVPPHVEVPWTPLNLHLGLDFGTRFTKVCFRDVGRDRSEVVAFSPLGEVRLDASLLPSHLVVQDGVIYGGLTDSEWTEVRQGAFNGAQVVDFLKIRLAQLDVNDFGNQWPLADIGELAETETLEALTAFYLARAMDRSRNWITKERHELFVRRTPLWYVSLGVPVQHCDSPALNRFQKVLRIAAAWADAGVGPTVTVEDLIPLARSFSTVEPTTECFVVEELGAAVRSFIASPQAPEGVYVFMDVGAGTLDGVSFRYMRDEGRPRLVCHSAAVEPLGISAVAETVAPAVGVPSRELENWLSKRTAKELRSLAELETVREQIRMLLAKILLEGKKKDRDGWSAGIEHVTRAFYRPRKDVTKFPLFVGGGGSLSDFYRETIASTYSFRPLEAANIKPYRLERVPAPQDLDMHGLPPEHFHRFTVAYGLSIPPGESGRLDLPSTVPPEEPPDRWSPKVTLYENTKELT